ncbi:MAG: choice-of-anchor I family protein [Trichodesmium sp.]
MKNNQGKNKYTNTNVLEKIIKLTAQSSFAVAMMAAPSMAGLTFTPVATYETGVFDDSAATHTAFDGEGNLFITNNSELQLDVLNISDPSNPELKFNIFLDQEDPKSVDLGDFKVGGVNDVAYSNGLFAVALENDTATDDGIVAFFNPYGDLINQVTVGALPDSLTFTPDGSKLLVANEGEPNDAYTIDPEGSVSIIDMFNFSVKTADFNAFDGQEEEDKLREKGVRIFGPGASASQDFEPENIAVSEDGTTAWVTLQENNAIAILDVLSGTFTDIVPMGYKNHSLLGNALDPSDRDGGINIENYPIFGMFQPDEIASYSVGGRTFLVTANEGDSREYIVEDDDGNETPIFVEETDVGSVTLDEEAFGGADEVARLQQDDVLGRLEITNTLGFNPATGKYEKLYAFGGRSFSILNQRGELVFDSGDDFERITAKELPNFFNATNDKNNFDNRSDNKGPEPEGVTIGEVNGRILAFIGLERVGGFMTYDITDPENPFFVDYINNRNFFGDPENGTAGDLGPEGLTFIPEGESPNGTPLLVVANEVSGTTTIYAINSVPEPGTIFGLLAFGAAGKLLLKRKSQTTQEQEKA